MKEKECLLCQGFGNHTGRKKVRVVRSTIVDGDWEWSTGKEGKVTRMKDFSVDCFPRWKQSILMLNE